MKNFLTLIILFTCLSVDGQTLDREFICFNDPCFPQAEQVNNWNLITGAMVLGTFLIVENMDVPFEYMDVPGMHQVRNRQRFTVAITGMVVTTITHITIDKIRTKNKHKPKKPKI